MQISVTSTLPEYEQQSRNPLEVVAVISHLLLLLLWLP